MTSSMQFTEGSRVSITRSKLHTLTCRPAANAKAGLLFLHGFQEHSGRYRNVFARLAEAGVACWSYDHHAHGRSEPSGPNDRALLSTFWHLVDDAEAYAKEIRQELRGLPFFLGGHSMGGLVACHLALRDQAAWQGLILCSAAVDVDWTTTLRVQAAVGGLLAALLPRAKLVPAVKVKHISTDEQTRQAYVNDPLNVVGNVRCRSGHEILGGMRALQREEQRLSLPLLALHGMEDHIAHPQAVRRLVDSCASHDAQLVEFPGSYHELLMGPERERALPLIQNWILERARPAEAAGSAAEGSAEGAHGLAGGPSANAGAKL